MPLVGATGCCECLTGEQALDGNGKTRYRDFARKVKDGYPAGVGRIDLPHGKTARRHRLHWSPGFVPQEPRNGGRLS